MSGLVQETDSYIIKLLKEDDEAALKIIFKIYFNQLLFFAAEFVPDKEIAREIVHDAIFRFWQHRSRLNDNTYVKAYLLKITRNLCLNYLIQIKNSRAMLVSSEEVQQELELNYEVLSDPDWDKLLIRELEDVLLQTIAMLPEKCRQVFELSRIKQYSNAEIAGHLKISVKTVEGHITEALKVIRSKISKYLHIIIFISLS